MGRKIKGSKHHGAKDPNKQRENREEKLKVKVNNRPKHDDEQEMPKRLMQLMQHEQHMMQHKQQKKQQKSMNKGDNKGLLDSSKYITKQERLPGMTRPLRPVPVFRQKQGESKKSFYYRMHQTIQGMKKQREYESEFKVELQRDQMGNTKVVEAEPDELEEIVDSHKKKKLAKKGIVLKSKEEKRQLRREREKKRKARQKRGGTNKQPADAKDFDDFEDKQVFGDTVHAPPSLNFKMRNMEEKMAGKASSLLLAQKLSKKQDGGGGVVKKAKKEHLSMAKKAMLEKERQRVVEAYRALKADKISF
eukprot:TRINITY_DN6637_c0_g1_i11.p1 TRINITY_DN6637_c0_g1~~TRINITY_DN6637_c0_g1_i11.p1  ORF type:complete len:319 (-),score=82.77 TRINITY_DN6637_c0_g1_i11:129-1043(-)